MILHKSTPKEQLRWALNISVGKVTIPIIFYFLLVKVDCSNYSSTVLDHEAMNLNNLFYVISSLSEENCHLGFKKHIVASNTALSQYCQREFEKQVLK